MDDERIQNEIIRLISNQIGVDDEWLVEGFKPSVGQSRI